MIIRILNHNTTTHLLVFVSSTGRLPMNVIIIIIIVIVILGVSGVRTLYIKTILVRILIVTAIITDIITIIIFTVTLLIVHTRVPLLRNCHGRRQCLTDRITTTITHTSG